jgi:hypothetical protein
MMKSGNLQAEYIYKKSINYAILPDKFKIKRA